MEGKAVSSVRWYLPGISSQVSGHEHESRRPGRPDHHGDAEDHPAGGIGLLEHAVDLYPQEGGEEPAEAGEGHVDAHVGRGGCRGGEIKVTEVPGQYTTPEGDPPDHSHDPEPGQPPRGDAEDQDQRGDDEDPGMHGPEADDVHAVEEP